MSKRKPDKVVVHRIELQQKERELLETYMIVEGVKDILPSIIAIGGTAAGGYMLATYLHMFLPNQFPAPPFLPESAENAPQNAFVSYARNYVENRTDADGPLGMFGYLNPFTIVPDIYRSIYETYQEGQSDPTSTPTDYNQENQNPTYPDGTPKADATAGQGAKTQQEIQDRIDSY